MITTQKTPCWALPFPGRAPLHFHDQANAVEAHTFYAALHGDAVAPAARLSNACIQVSCECGAYTLGDDAEGFEQHFTSLDEARTYGQRMGTPLAADGTIACDVMHGVMEQAPASAMHIGRAWEGTSAEDDCLCGKGECGLVLTTAMAPGCREHGSPGRRPIRQMHSAQACERMHAVPAAGRSMAEVPRG